MLSEWGCKILPTTAPIGPSLLRKLGRRGLEWLFPADCAACETPLKNAPCGWFCEDCWRQLAAPYGPVCDLCGLRFESREITPASHCGDCIKAPPAFDRARVMAPYDGVAGKALRLLKYASYPAVARALVAQADLAQAPAELWRVERVVPVPIHPNKLRSRGYNQAGRLATALAQRIGVPMDDGLLFRQGPQLSQVGLRRAARQRNVRSAFRLAEGANVDGLRLLLVDDVMTTGATLSACARVLKRAGARRVMAWSVARQERS